MSTEPFFRMTVEDVFYIRGRGTVVTGRVEHGALKTGDTVYIKSLAGAAPAVVTGIEMFRKVRDQAQAGDNVGVLLRDVGPNDVRRGDVLTGS